MESSWVRRVKVRVPGFVTICTVTWFAGEHKCRGGWRGTIALRNPAYRPVADAPEVPTGTCTLRMLVLHRARPSDRAMLIT